MDLSIYKYLIIIYDNLGLVGYPIRSSIDDIKYGLG